MTKRELVAKMVEVLNEPPMPVPDCECCGHETPDLWHVTITPLSPYPRLRLRAIDGRKATAWLCSFCADDQ